MDLKDKLEIFIVTFNRKVFLEKTLQQILDDKSPVKNLDITILNNKSYDGTTELINKYCEEHKNLHHIINKRNIGGNANIARAFELASKKYVWILCDDDEYNWSHWDEVENAIKQNYAAIVVANYINPKKHIGYLVKQMTFTPSTIYRTDCITDTVMCNIEYCISTMFPHMAVALSIINDKKKIYICNNWTVNMVSHGGVETYVRGLNKTDAHPYMSNMFWSVGYVNVCQLIQNKTLRYQILSKMHETCVLSDSWSDNIKHIITFNENNYKNNLKNSFDIICGLTRSQRLSFVFLLAVRNFLPRFYKSNCKVFIKFWVFKTKIWPLSLKGTKNYAKFTK